MSRRRHGILFATVGVVLFVVYLALSDPFSALRGVASIDGGLLLLAIVVDLAGLVLFAVSWLLLLRGMGGRVGVLDAVQATFVSFFVVWMIPIPVGSEIVRAYLVRGESGAGRAVASVAVHKSLYNISFGVLISLSAILVTASRGSTPISDALLIFVVAFGFGSSLLFAALLSRRLLGWMNARLPARFRALLAHRAEGFGLRVEGFGAIIDEIEEAVASLRSRLMLGVAAFLMVAFHWSTGAITAHLIALSLGVRIEFWEVVLIYAVVEFIQQLNILIPGGLGVVDAGMTGAFALLGIPLPMASAISLLTRLVTYWLELAVCSAVSLRYGYREALKEYFAKAG